MSACCSTTRSICSSATTLPDTLKCQHTFKLTAGHCLYSDMGRIFCSVVADDFGWHDTVCGNTTKASTAKKWGETSYQTRPQRLAAERS